MMQSEKKITRDNALDIIKQFAKEYRKELGKAPAEIIIVGGGSIMLNYKFREATQDFDVILKAASGARDVIKRFADEQGLPRDWMNTDFIKTASYSDALSEVSKHYCSLNNGALEIRTVSGVYLIAMKLRANRDYRNDISDAIGVLIEERRLGNAISYADIENAYSKLYKTEIPDKLAEIMGPICDKNIDELQAYYDMQNKMEHEVGDKIVTYINEGANINTKNVDEVTAKIREKMKALLGLQD